MCHVGVQSTAVARGVQRHAPWENFLNAFSETHSGAFSAQYNDGKIVHQNPLVSSYIRRSACRCLFLELVMSCLPRLTTNVSCGFTLVLDMSKSFAFSNSNGG